MPARKRLMTFFDEGSTEEHGQDILPKDRIKFKDSIAYPARLTAAQKKTGETDALIVMSGKLKASLANLGDIIVAEPNALIGFAGPRVIKETVREVLPEGFQRSEFLYKHGAIDLIVDRKDMRDTLHRLLSKLMHTQMAS
eukprot:gene648-1982_t